jgi:cytochrome c550
MKRNPVMPFGIIAVLGILTVIIISYVGVAQQEDILAAEEGGEPEQAVEEGEVAAEPDAMYEANCSACHGADLSGGMGPELTAVESSYSADEISNIILNGQGDMPAVDVTPEEADAISEWLIEQE